MNATAENLHHYEVECSIRARDGRKGETTLDVDATAPISAALTAQHELEALGWQVVGVGVRDKATLQ